MSKEFKDIDKKLYVLLFYDITKILLFTALDMWQWTTQKT